MRIFVSWSGDLSHQVGAAIKDWLGFVIQSVDCFVSSEDISKGSRWSESISSELDGADFGIICVTPDNLEKPWLNFEAGALSRSFVAEDTASEALVAPFLVGLPSSEIPKNSPLLQFQVTEFEKEDVFKLIESINRANVGETRDREFLRTTFDTWWPNLEKRLQSVLQASGPAQRDGVSGAMAPAPRSDTDILEEVLELSRETRRMVSNPDRLFPQEFLAQVLRREARGSVDLTDSGDLALIADCYSDAANDLEVWARRLSEMVLDESFESFLLAFGELGKLISRAEGLPDHARRNLGRAYERLIGGYYRSARGRNSTSHGVEPPVAGS